MIDPVMIEVFKCLFVLLILAGTAVLFFKFGLKFMIFGILGLCKIIGEILSFIWEVIKEIVGFVKYLFRP